MTVWNFLKYLICIPSKINYFHLLLPFYIKSSDIILENSSLKSYNKILGRTEILYAKEASLENKLRR